MVALRWQYVPLALGALVALGGLRWAHRRGRRVLAALAAGGLGLLGVVALWAFPVLRIPVPTGGEAVGTTVVQWTDAARRDRTVVAQLWYPASADHASAKSTYLGRDAHEAGLVADGLADTFGVPSFLLAEARRARTNAGWQADPAPGTAPWPVVLFSPGLGGVRTQNSAWAEEVASHGYVVVALDHPEDSAVVVLDDGTAIRSLVRSTGDDAKDERLANGWATVRAADLRFVRSQLDDLGGLRVDQQRVAVAGHSIGGAAAIQAAIEEPTGFQAVIDLDGFPRNLGSTPLERPVLFVVAGRGTGNPSNDQEYDAERRRVLDGAPAGSEEMIVPGASHLTFTDAPLFLPPVPSLVGALGRRGGVDVTAQLTLDFLGRTLA